MPAAPYTGAGYVVHSTDKLTAGSEFRTAKGYCEIGLQISLHSSPSG